MESIIDTIRNPAYILHNISNIRIRIAYAAARRLLPLQIEAAAAPDATAADAAEAAKAALQHGLFRFSGILCIMQDICRILDWIDLTIRNPQHEIYSNNFDRVDGSRKSYIKSSRRFFCIMCIL